MGVVYRAGNRLNRPVAPVLLGRFADPGQGKRFLAEETVARLDHSARLFLCTNWRVRGAPFLQHAADRRPSPCQGDGGICAAGNGPHRSQQEGLPLRPLLRKCQTRLAAFVALFVACCALCTTTWCPPSSRLEAGRHFLGRGAPHYGISAGTIMDRDYWPPPVQGMSLAHLPDMPPEQTVDPHNVTVAADVYSAGHRL